MQITEPLIIIGWQEDGELGFAIQEGTSPAMACLMIEEAHRRLQASLRFKKASNLVVANAMPAMGNGRG